MRHECIVIAETRQSSGINSLKRKSRRLMGESVVRRLFRELIANTPMLWLPKCGICPLYITSNV
jgi:hypothetical protein